MRRRRVSDAELDRRAAAWLRRHQPPAAAAAWPLVVRCRRCRGQAALEREGPAWVYYCLHCGERWTA